MVWALAQGREVQMARWSPTHCCWPCGKGVPAPSHFQVGPGDELLAGPRAPLHPLNVEHVD